MLRKREDIIILKADKGNTTIVMKKEDYDQKMKEHLACGRCKKIKIVHTTIIPLNTFQNHSMQVATLSNTIQSSTDRCHPSQTTIYTGGIPLK